MIAYRYNISYSVPMALHHPTIEPLYQSGLYRDRRNCTREMAHYASRRDRPLSDFKVIRTDGHEAGSPFTGDTRFRFVEIRCR